MGIMTGNFSDYIPLLTEGKSPIWSFVSRHFKACILCMREEKTQASLCISGDTHDPSFLYTSVNTCILCMPEEKTLTSLRISEDTHEPSFLDTSKNVSCVCEKRSLWRVYVLAKTRMSLRFSTLQYLYLVYARREDSDESAH